MKVTGIPGALVEKWTPSDRPHNEDQAFECIRYYAETRMHMGPEMLECLYNILVINETKPAKPVLCMGSHLGGWAFTAEEGTYGNFGEDKEAAKNAADQYYVERLVNWAKSTGRIAELARMAVHD